jgi:hypothetical protein
MYVCMCMYRFTHTHIQGSFDSGEVLQQQLTAEIEYGNVYVVNLW